MEYLSNIELYYSVYPDFSLVDDEAKHITKVMRHKPSDIIYITDGKGSIIKAEIVSVGKEQVTVNKLQTYNYQNENDNVFFCIPVLKNPDRLSFALEKSIELGITNFIFYLPEKGLKKEIKIERYSRIGFAAMKQSLRAYLPVFQEINCLNLLDKYNADILYFDQKGERNIFEFELDRDKKTIFVFGGEGGFSENEIKYLNAKQSLTLTVNRLRSETAIISAAAYLTIKTH